MIGYIGLGNMGGALARRLQLREPLLVFDGSKAAVDRTVAAGATRCESVADLASRCEIVCLCLPTSAEVRSVIFSEDGVLSSAQPGTTIIDQTTGDPIATRAMAAELREHGLELVDAPVSGGVRGAEAGTIAIMVGATPPQYELVAPVLEKISPNLFHAGDVGAGHTIKLVNNLLSGAQRLLSYEAVGLATKNGVDAEKAVEVLTAGGGRNAYLERNMGDIIHGRMQAAFTLGLAHKDLRLACQLGIDSGVPMLFGNVARELYQMCISEMGRDAKVDTVGFTMDRLGGTEVMREFEH